MSNGIMKKVGSWAFILGIIIALIFGLWEAVQLEDNTSFFATDTGGIKMPPACRAAAPGHFESGAKCRSSHRRK